MAEHPEKPRTSLTEPAKSGAAAREERLARALRDNLRRRKAQARARASDDEPGTPERQD